jgi:hypothetical protein
LRWKVLALSTLAVAGALQSVAQQAHPPSQLENLLRPQVHARPTPANAPRSPQVTFEAGSLGSPMVLDKGWRVGITANSAAATPDFDDSTWAVRDAKDFIADVADEDHPSGAAGTADKPDPSSLGTPPPGHQRPFAWFRLHIKLAPNHGPVALLIELPVSQNTAMVLGSTGPSVDVFVNGKLVEPEGPHGNALEHYQQISRIYDLNLAPGQTDVTVAVRTIYIPFGFAAYTSFFSGRKLQLGNRSDLDRSLELWSAHGLFERIPRLVNSILLLVLAVFLLALYFSQKGHIEYLWLALHELLQAPIGFVELAGSSAHIDSLLYAAIVLQLVVISAYLYFEFLIAFLSLRSRWYIRTLRYTAPILAGIGPSLLLVGHFSAVGILLAIIFVLSFVWILGWLLFIFITLIVATIKRNFEAGLLLIPLVLSMVGLSEPLLTAGMANFEGRPYHSYLTILAGPVPIHFASIADFSGIFVIVLIIFVRFLRIHHEQRAGVDDSPGTDSDPRL